MKRIVDQAIYEKHVSQENKNLVKDFLIEKKAQGKAASTLQQYNWDLRIILFLIHEHFENKNLIELTRKDIRNLSIIFQDMGMSNARVNGLMSALRSALEFCADDDDYNYEFNVGSRVRGKRGKKFRLYYNPRVQECIRLYMNQRGKDTIPDLFVRVYKNGGRKTLNKSVFNYWCKIFAKMLNEKEGKEFKINPHCFRHSRLDNLKVQGVPLEKLKSLANHSDISITESYLKDRSEEDIAEIFGMDPSYFAA
ncbi:hypothetical protein IIU_01556 [Bacillus cereus VD133]|uniref:Tyr recombinase domain-containing protein n=1 Tax=Bacillus cereus VD133 TaxID=1053233 RepID=A0A9W5V454_BACCE|nr:site-specific integrase [Bacillus cereus]EOO36953.1 hypothetical protein IIU_01556 [Bacillus cereus VD133]